NTCERLALNVTAHFAEMAFDGFPCTASCDAHFLMVITLTTARGERISQPEATCLGNRIGSVGESCSTFVGRDHEIGVVIVVTQNTRRRDDLAIGTDIVGDVEQCTDEGLISRRTDFLYVVAASTFRNTLWEKATLGADRHDNRIL